MPSIQEEIRQNLSRMGVSGISIDIRYDVRSNVAMVRFNFNGKNYDEIEKVYKKLAKAFHPDMALSEEAKKEFEKRFGEINQAYSEIKKERGSKL